MTPETRRAARRSLAPALILALASGLARDSAGSEAQDVRIEETHPALLWTGAWSSNPLAANSGSGARLAMDAGSRVLLTFTGDSVRWIGYRDEWSGRADVSLDGVFQSTVDTFSKPAQAQATLFTASDLGGGRHTLTIEVAGTHDRASSGSWVWIDAFVVTGGAEARTGRAGRELLPEPLAAPEGRQGNGVRSRRGGDESAFDFRDPAVYVEEDDTSIRWTGFWAANHLAGHRGQGARLSMEPGSRVDFVFTGTGAAWIGYSDEWSGIAEVRVDGALRGTVDTWAKDASAQIELFSVRNLREGRHTLSLRPTGRQGVASRGAWIWVDAFSITR